MLVKIPITTAREVQREHPEAVEIVETLIRTIQAAVPHQSVEKDLTTDTFIEGILAPYLKLQWHLFATPNPIVDARILGAVAYFLSKISDAHKKMAKKDAIQKIADAYRAIIPENTELVTKQEELTRILIQDGVLFAVPSIKQQPRPVQRPSQTTPPPPLPLPQKSTHLEHGPMNAAKIQFRPNPFALRGAAGSRKQN